MHGTGIYQCFSLSQMHLACTSSSLTLHFVPDVLYFVFDFITAHVVLSVIHSFFCIGVHSFCDSLSDVARAPTLEVLSLVRLFGFVFAFA